MDLRLDNQVAFVAGSSRGIGKAIAAALLAEGACVVLTGRDEASLQSAEEELATADRRQRVLAVAGDFADTATIARAYEATIAKFGRIDALVANLGTGSGKPGWEQSAEE